MSSNDQAKKKAGKSKTNEEIIAGFNKLRHEQRYLTTKVAEMELEQHEHKIVLHTLKDLDGNRKCYRMIGGVLCERTVKDVTPVLAANEQQLSKVIESLNQQLVAKGVEINAYKDEHNVKIKGIDELSQLEAEEKSTAGGVLVS